MANFGSVGEVLETKYKIINRVHKNGDNGNNLVSKSDIEVLGIKRIHEEI